MMKKKHLFFNSKGFSLIEVMMVVGIMAIVGLGAASLMKNLFSIQRRTEIKPTVRFIKAQLEQALQNDQAWENTFNNAGNLGALGCLQDATADCADNFTAANFEVYNDANALIFDADNPAAGWDFQGNVCTAWNAAGNNGCPFRYNLSWRAECPGTATCPKPLVVLSADLLYAPTDLASSDNRLDIDSYRIRIRRGERVKNEQFQIGMRDPGGGATGGACANNAWTTRPLNFIQPAGVNSATRAGNQFTLVAGSYTCEVVAEAYNAVDGFQLRLRDLGGAIGPFPAGHGYTEGFTPKSTTSTRVIYLTLTAATTFVLEHWCGDDGNPPAASSTGDPSEMGQSNPNFQATWTQISCNRTN